MSKMKKLISLLLTGAMILSMTPMIVMAEAAVPDEAPAGSGLYPNAAYTTVASELDGTGNWIYRELVPDVGCETEISPALADYAVIQNPSKQVATKRVDNEKYTGNYSWYRRAITNRGVDFQIKPNIIAPNQQYISSAWLRSDMEGATEGQDASNVKVKTYVNYVIKEAWLGTTKSLSKTWQKFDLSFTAPSDYDASKNFNIAIANCDSANATSYTEQRSGKSAQPVYSIYVDDWSIRRAIPADFANSYTKSISPSAESPFVKNGDKVTFTFSLDIDPRTARKENITVNGTANSTNISAVNVVTDENTRQTTLEITMANLADNQAYTVALPEIKDAWGRDVVGANSTAVYCADIADGQYTIFEELDSSGKWAYRNLIPDEECETIDGFWDNDAANKIAGTDQTVAQLSTTSHSGTYSVSRKMQGYAALGAQVDTLDVPPAEYVLNVWAKADLHQDAGESISLTPCYGYYTTGETKVTTSGFTYPSTDVNVSIDNEWGYYTKKLQLYPSAVIDKTKATYMYFYANKKVDSVTLLNTIYLDDWNFRKLPSWDVYATGVSVSGNTAVFTFDKDIDKWTVTADKILVNGIANSGKITAAVVETDELTRETTLTVTASETIDDDFVISLPETAKDAWGRDIKNKVQTGLSFGKTNVFDSSNAVVTDVRKLTAGETYTYKINGIVNGSANSADVTALLALYDNSGKCVQVDIDTKTFAPSTQNGSLSASVTVPQNASGYTLKPFIWNLNTLVPYEKPLKVLFIGNSYTYHTPDVSKGWLGDWGMAASSADKDYAHLLTAMLNKDSKNINVKIKNISNIEADFTANGIATNAAKYYQDAVDFDADIIIATFGANIKDASWEGDEGYENTVEFTKADYKNIIDKFNPGSDAVVIAGDTLNGELSELNKKKKAAIKGASDDNGYIYVELDDIITAFPARDDYAANPTLYANALTSNANDAVLRHPGDTGMRYLANRLYVRGIINAFKMLGMNYTNINELEMPAN